MNSQSKGLMKEIGEQFIESLDVDKKGHVLINYSKINPYCADVVQNSVIKYRALTEEAVEEVKQEQQPEENVDYKKILVKNTKFFDKSKFLILIYMVERKVTRIVKSS